MNGHCKGNPFCTSLSDEVRNRLCAACIKLRLRSGQEMESKQPPSHILILSSGVVHALFALEEDNWRSTELFTPGNLIGATRLLVTGTVRLQEATLVAVTDVEIGLIPTDVFQELLENDIEMSLAVLRSVSVRLHDALWYWTTKSRPSEQALSLVLTFLEQRGVDSSQLTHEKLATLVDMNRVTVTRAMKSVQRRAGEVP